MQTKNPYLIYCGGEFIATHRTLEVADHSDGGLAGITFLAGELELEQAIAAAGAVEEEMAAMPSYIRHRILKQIGETLLTQKQAFGELIARESGKPIRYALGEVDRSVQSFIVAAEESKRLPNEYLSVDWTPAGQGKEAFVKYFPVGIVAGIAPFNFPLNLAVHKIAPAIAAGCPIILKPSSLTPLTTLLLAHIIADTELPKGAVSILPMDRTTGNRLVTDERIGLLSFTGSPEIGWQMKRDARKKKVVLELGGNAGAIISQGTDLDSAVSKCVVGAFAYSGQVCIHTQRIFVLENLFHDFVEKFVAKAKTMRFGNPLDPETDMAGMIDLVNAKRIERWVEDAVAGGARILLGGKREGKFMPPTVLTATLEAMQVFADEVFGPVVVIEPVADFQEAIDKVNAGRFGLQAGVFTDSISEMNLAFSRLKVGGVIINDVPTFRVDHTPYGGIKDSGLGREGIKYAMMDMMEPRLLVKGF